jgi:predicted small metal-binding protein
MKKLSCKELWTVNCNFKIKGRTEEEIIDAIFAHAAEEHPDKLMSMSEDEKADLIALIYTKLIDKDNIEDY